MSDLPGHRHLDRAPFADYADALRLPPGMDLADISPLGNPQVDCPDSLYIVPLRILLASSQTNVTPNPVDGLLYATAAYDAARSPRNTTNDPTAAGEAAAKAGFRAAQAGMPRVSFESWFSLSRDALAFKDTAHFLDMPRRPAADRELIATDLLHGRALLHHVLNQPAQLGNGAQSSLLSASSAHDGAMRLAESQHRGNRWDPYAIMAGRYRALGEHMLGGHSKALTIVTTNIGRALRTDPDNGSRLHQNPEIVKPMTPAELSHFITKQTIANLATTAVVTSAPFARDHTQFSIKHREQVRRLVA